MRQTGKGKGATCNAAHNCPLLSAQGIDQARLAHIRPADDGNSQRLILHLHLLPDGSNTNAVSVTPGGAQSLGMHDGPHLVFGGGSVAMTASSISPVPVPLMADTG